MQDHLAFCSNPASKSVPTWLADIGKAVFSSLFDRDPISWKLQDEAGVRPVRRLGRRPVGSLHRFKSPLNRNAFLLGCLDFTEHQAIEHLIIGLGKQWGSTIRITEGLHWAGSTHAVAVPSGLREGLVAFLSAHPDHRVVVFHNHPMSIWDALLDLKPVASVADRQVMLNHLLEPEIALKSLLSGPQLHWFVGQNGWVREFSTPDLLGIAKQFGLGLR